MKITTFDEMIAAARQTGPVPIGVVAAHDPEVLKAVDQAQREGIPISHYAPGSKIGKAYAKIAKNISTNANKGDH